MSNSTSYIEMHQEYPFNVTQHKSDSPLQVKQVVEYDLQPRFILKEKIRMLKSLGFQNLVGLQSSKSDDNTITLYFECVGGQLMSQIGSMSVDQLGKIYSGMLELGETLASKWIVHDFQLKRIGLDKRYNLKYFLGLDFKVDKSINKQLTQQNYKTQITSFLNQINKNCNTQTDNKVKTQNVQSPKNQGQLSPKISNIMNSIELGQRKILKKSSILETEHKDESSNVLKASSRFTFNNDNHITIPVKDKNEEEEAKGETRPLKIEQLNTRITRLKDYMKQITKKVPPTRNTNLREDPQSTQKPFEKRRSNPRQKKYEAKATKIETVQIGEKGKKNPINIQDNRQHKEYIMLANKDKYCEQFMLFLEDNMESQRLEEESKKVNNHRENLKTQSSEMTLEIQNRVQKVIRSSLRLINGLKSRQSIRCE